MPNKYRQIANLNHFEKFVYFLSTKNKLGTAINY